MDGSPPPLPERPEIDPKPRGSWLTIALVAFCGVAVAIVLTFLTLGFFGPFVILGLAIFAVIGLQYLVWGWLFERVYRSSVSSDDPATFSNDDK
jgi:hypothetical protein